MSVTDVRGLRRMTRPVDVEASLMRHGGAQAGNPSQLAQQADYTRIIYPWWVNKLPSSQDFNAQDFAMPMPAGIGSQVTSGLLAFQMPQTMIGVIQIFGLYILSPLATTSLQFTLRINQAPVSGWDNIQFPPGAANFVVQNFSALQVKVSPGSTVDVLVTNLDGAAVTCGGKIAGWYNPQTEVARINGEYY